MAEQVTTVQQPWAAQADHLRSAFQQARLLAQTPLQYFPGQTFAGFTPQQEMALGLTEARARGGSPYERAFGQYLTGALQQPNVNVAPGAYGAQQAISGLTPGQQSLGGFASGQGINPYLDAQFEAASRGLGTHFRENVLPSVGAQFGGAGRTGSGAHHQAVRQAQQEFGRTSRDLAADIYGRGYEAERGRQLSAAQSLQQGGLRGIDALTNLYGQIGQQRLGAAGLVPSAQAVDYANIDRLYGAGQRVQDLDQARIQDQINRWNFLQQQPWQQLERYSALIQNRPWGGSTTTTGASPYPPVGQQIVGAGLQAGAEAIDRFAG